MIGVVALALFAQEASAAAASPPAQAPVQGASYGPAAPRPPRKPRVTAPGADRCASAKADNAAQDIIVCAAPGFRIDPDVIAAQKARKRGSRPTSPYPSSTIDKNCGTIGPMGCRFGPSINVIAAAATAAEMARRAVTGGNVGQMFVTDPQPSEYRLYQEAKAAREAKEAEAAARAKAAADAR